MRSIKTWSNDLVISFFQDTIEELTDEQLQALAFHVQNEYEERRKAAQKFLTEHQNNNYEPSR